MVCVSLSAPSAVWMRLMPSCALRLVQTTDLVLQLLADGQAGGVVARLVDAQAGRQALGLTGVGVLAGRQAALSDGRGEVVVDA
jgi:hypothetical protein